MSAPPQFEQHIMGLNNL